MNAINADRMHGEAHGKDHPAGAPHHKVNYLAIFLALVVGTAITVAVAFLDIESEWKKVLIALIVASVKGGLVAYYFMHLKFEGKMIYFIFFVPLCFVVIVVCALIPDIVVAKPMVRPVGHDVPVMASHP